MIVTKSNEILVEEWKAKILKVFEMTNFGLISYFLRIEMKQECDESFHRLKEVCRGNNQMIMYESG